MPRSSHREIWSLLGEARISIGISFSDGLPNSLIEAMIYRGMDRGRGQRPLVPPDDPEAIVAAVVEALGADEAVDAAADANRRLAFERADEVTVRRRALTAYRHALEVGRNRSWQDQSG